MTATAVGPKRWNVKRSPIGHRTYGVTFRVVTTSVSDGPLTVMAAAGLPILGTFWAFGDEFDPWAFCSPEMTVRPMQNNQVCTEWEVDMTFTTVPFLRCQDTSIQDPLSEPYKIGGSFCRYTWQPSRDMNNKPIIMSNLEPITGPLNEYDRNRPNVWIEFNQLTLGIENWSLIVDNVNDSPLWGLPARCVKFSNPTWTRLLYGVCTYYYKLRFEFDIRYPQKKSDGTVVGGFDTVVIDQGRLVIIGKWNLSASPPVWVPQAFDKTKPASYDVFKGPGGELKNTWLDGNGNPNTTATPVENVIKYYPQTNLLALGIPSSL